jgi:two-component system response regulator NreC
MRKLKILLADDHTVMREGLRRLIDGESDMEVVCEAADGDEAVEKAAQLHPDVAVLDVSMKHVGGPDAARRINKLCPAVRVLGLTMHEDASYVREMVDAGAVGYVLKRAASEELIRAIRAVAHGGTYVDPRVAGRLLQSLVPGRSLPSDTNTLSERENDVLRLIAQGFSNKEIAAQLNVSVKTVETYKGRGMEKLGLRTRVDIVRTAAARGWLATS